MAFVPYVNWFHLPNHHCLLFWLLTIDNSMTQEERRKLPLYSPAFLFKLYDGRYTETNRFISDKKENHLLIQINHVMKFEISRLFQYWRFEDLKMWKFDFNCCKLTNVFFESLNDFKLFIITAKVMSDWNNNKFTSKNTKNTPHSIQFSSHNIRLPVRC